MSDTPMDKGRDAVFVTLRVNERPIGDTVFDKAGHIEEGPVKASVGRGPRGFELRGEGQEAQPVGAERVEVRGGNVAVSASLVRRFRLARWVLEQSDVVLPLVMLSCTVLAMQIALIVSLLAAFLAPPPGPSAPEPSPEYLTRLLNGDYAGADQGVVAKPAEPRAPSDTKIDSYYLPAGSPGPVTHAGGGKRVGRKPRDGDARPQKAQDSAIKIEDLGATQGLTPQDTPPEPTIDDLADPLASANGTQDDQPEAVAVTEGWGLTDWYDTEDARKDAEEIQRELDLSRQLLKLDPDNLYGLSVRAYYEYLAMDYDAAEKTYDRQLQLDGTSGAPWNNLALVYKRKGDYQKEEELYRTSLMMEPDESNTYINLALCLGHQGRFDEALQIMKRMEKEIPPGDENEGYADLYRSQIYALMGNEDEAYRYLRKSLSLMRKLDTLHNIEFQQDIRVDPAFKAMRDQPRFKKMLTKFYGERPGGWWIFKGEGGGDE